MNRKPYNSIYLILTLISVALIISACGSSNNNDGDANGGSDSSSEEPQRSETPLNLAEMVSNGIENGDWSEGEGLTTALKFLVGESELPDDIQTPMGIDYHSAWQLSNQANLYLEGDASDAEKAEVERLLNIIAPTDEILVQYAVPMGTSYRSPGLSAPDDLQVDCRTLWAEGFVDSFVDPPICLEYADTASYDGHRGRVYFPTEFSTDSNVQSAVANSLDALEDAINRYRSLGVSFRSINLIYTQLADDAVTYAFTPNRPSGEVEREPCPILVYPRGVEMNNADPQKFKQIIAHEIFHCVQYWRYGQLNISSVAWWAESSAIYFSNLVYPSVNQEYEYIGEFDELSTYVNLTDSGLSYGGFVFFMYLGNQRGPTAVIDLTDSLSNRYGSGSPEGSSAAQQQALSRYSGIQEFFHQFGRDYLDRRISDTSGGFLPVNPRPGDTIIYPGEPPPPSTPAFTLSRYQILFQDEHEYEVMTSTSGATGRSAVRPSDVGDDWGAIPPKVRASCGPALFKLLITSTEPSDYHTLELEVSEEEGLECDDCLVGHWEMNTDVLIPYMVETLHQPPDLIFLGLTGIFNMDIYDDGRYVFTPESYTLHTLSVDDDHTTDILMEMQGFVVGQYGITDEGLLRMWEDDITFSIKNTMIIDGGAPITLDIPMDPRAAPISFAVEDAEYTCTGNSFTVQTPVVAPVNEHVYRRISTEPEPHPLDVGGAPADP